MASAAISAFLYLRISSAMYFIGGGAHGDELVELAGPPVVVPCAPSPWRWPPLRRSCWAWCRRRSRRSPRRPRRNSYSPTGGRRSAGPCACSGRQVSAILRRTPERRSRQRRPRWAGGCSRRRRAAPRFGAAERRGAEDLAPPWWAHREWEGPLHRHVYIVHLRMSLTRA